MQISSDEYKKRSWSYRTLKPKSFREYIYNNLLSVDILFNTLLGGRVRTMSERIGEKKLSVDKDGKSKWSKYRYPIHWFVDTYILEPLDPGHSIDAYIWNKEFTDG